MSNDEIRNHPLIKQYIKDLFDQLAYIPQAEKEQHVLEIRDHLQSLVKGKIKQGKNIDQAVEETLKEFLPVEKLAEKIMDEEELMNVVKGDDRYHSSNDTNGKAMVSFVLGILSIVFMIVAWLGLLLAVTGLVLGIIALNEIKRLKQKGKRLAVAGVICSSLGMILPILLSILAWFAFMNPAVELQ